MVLSFLGLLAGFQAEGSLVEAQSKVKLVQNEKQDTGYFQISEVSGVDLLAESEFSDSSSSDGGFSDSSFSDSSAEASSSSSDFSDGYDSLACYQTFEDLEEEIVNYRNDYEEVACDTEDYLDSLNSYCNTNKISADYVGCLAALKSFHVKVAKNCDLIESGEESGMKETDDDTYEYILIYCGYGEDVVIILGQEEMQETSSSSEGISSVEEVEESSSEEGSSETVETLAIEEQEHGVQQMQMVLLSQ